MDELLSQLSPEDLEQLFGLGTLDERGDLLSQQMAMAEALRRPSGQQHTTPIGAALGGIADVAGAWGGSLAEQKLQGQQADLLKQKDAGRKAYAEAIARFLRNKQAPSGPMGMGDVGMLPPGVG